MMNLDLLDNLWSGLAVWTALYASDYSLTLACARMYRHGVGEKIVFEGSYELTPYFQPDIDALKRSIPVLPMGPCAVNGRPLRSPCWPSPSRVTAHSKGTLFAHIFHKEVRFSRVPS
jgi:hypothetical protein